jgi:asparagine synthase (glutamine-hydrolysing)
MEAALRARTFPWLALFSGASADKPNLYSPELRAQSRIDEYIARRYAEALAEVPRLAGEDEAAARMREVFYLALTRWLPVLLDRKDRMSMAVGFEVRVPFCDYRLVEYAWNIPWEMKNVGGIEKGVLRRALAGVLPEDAVLRRKSQYPSVQHPDYVRGVRERTLAMIDDRAAPVRPFLDLGGVRALAESFGEDAAEAFRVRPLEHLLQVDAWLRTYRVRIR